MKKVPFVTLDKLQEITAQFPTPFHLYDEKGIRENAKAVKEAFAWNKGFKEFFHDRADDVQSNRMQRGRYHVFFQ